MRRYSSSQATGNWEYSCVVFSVTKEYFTRVGHVWTKLSSSGGRSRGTPSNYSVSLSYWRGQIDKGLV